MKPITALITAMLGGVATFVVQEAYFPPQAFAASFVVPDGPDWRQQMVARDPGSAAVDRSLARLTTKLDLTPDQANRIRPLLQQRHERIVALLLTAPPSMTRDQFMADRHQITTRTRGQVELVLTPDQRELAEELAPPAKTQS
jgi:hypothetical protein